MDNVKAHIKKFYDSATFILTSVAGTVDAVTATLDPTLDGDGLVNGMEFIIIWAGANTTALTLNIGTGDLPVVSESGNALPAGTTSAGLISVLTYYSGEFYMTGRSPLMTGDSGSGGLAGLVPPPSPGDGAAGKALLADGTWGSMAGSGFELLGVLAISGAGSGDIALPTSGYSSFRVEAREFVNSNTSGFLFCQISTNTGSSFLGSGYSGRLLQSGNFNTANLTAAALGSAGHFRFVDLGGAYAAPTAARYAGNYDALILSGEKSFQWVANNVHQSSNAGGSMILAQNNPNAQVDYLRFGTTSGTCTVTIYLYGMKDS